MTLMRLLCLILLIFTAHYSNGQEKFHIHFENNSYQQFIKHPKTEFKDSSSLISYLRELQLSAISKGFILASMDSVRFHKKDVYVNFVLGDKLNKVVIDIDDNEAKFLRKKSRLNEKLISKVPFNPKELSLMLRKIRNVYLDNGYPFVGVQLTEHKYQGIDLYAKLAVNRGDYFIWSKIHVKGDSSTSPRFVSNLLGIHIGDMFRESELIEISAKIDQVPFIREIKPSEMLFTKDGAELFLYLERVPISAVNGVIGFQPNPTSKKLSITGELNLKLLNTLQRGELLDVRWQSIMDQTQSLNARLNYPYLFKTPFGIDATFNLYKRDTSFLELNSSIGVQYTLNKGRVLKAFYQNISSSVLSGGLNNPLFSNLGNTKSNGYGLSFVSKSVDYLPNPSRGVNFTFSGTMGNRKSQINDTSQIVKSLTYRVHSTLEFFIPIFSRHIIRLASLTDFYAADNIFENEVYRYGGLQSQRGFNEDELFATTKTTGTIEYRFLLDKNSHVFAFYDQSWYENNASTYMNDSPLGFGLGFSFSTNFGVFSISYALGKQQSNPILFSNSKVHFGYIVYF